MAYITLAWCRTVKTVELFFTLQFACVSFASFFEWWGGHICRPRLANSSFSKLAFLFAIFSTSTQISCGCEKQISYCFPGL